MPRVYELPTHLQVEDQLIAGLTIRQLLRVVVGACAAYCFWDRAPWMSSDLRLAAAGVPVIIGLLFALLQPGGRSLDQWLLAMLLFFAMPRRLAWQPSDHAPRLQLPGRDADWAELDVHPHWLAPSPTERRCNWCRRHGANRRRCDSSGVWHRLDARFA